MKFTKNNTIKRKHHKSSPYSKTYIEEKRDEMFALIAKAKTDKERDNIAKAFNISINP